MAATSRRPEGTLRKGWTTGACAAAAARAAFEALHTGRFADPVTIRLPRGERPSFALARRELADGRATAGIVKDAGDDPDVTHGALILATVEPAPAGSGVAFRAGEGVGTVTRPGLALAVGEPAINPGPRVMIAQAIADAAEGLGVADDAVITIAVPGGAALAAQTLNARLGIRGGLSILGTTGVVVPYSCASWIHTIHRGVDVARAAGRRHVAGATGTTSERAVRALHGLDEVALIDMGDFVGALLKYLRRHPVERLTIAGGFGKLAKLAQGHLDLHSARSQVDLAALAALAGTLGADAAVARTASAAELLEASGAAGSALAQRIAGHARAVALATLSGGIAVDVAIFDRAGLLIAHVGP
jgi:cobalt-precorrin-5B (C1)-methyltransferase